MIKAVFLDAGGVILDESVFESTKALIITNIIKQFKAYTIEEYWRDTEEAVYRYVSSTYEYVLFKNLEDKMICEKMTKKYKDEYKKTNLQYSTMTYLEVLLELLSKQYQIGILGQYDSSLVSFLKDKGLDKYFAFMETQEKYSVTKPDPRYFLQVIEGTGLSPNECLMIGDRIDKDIYPANIIGMKNIRVRTGVHKKQEPRLFIEMPNCTVDSLKQIDIDLIKRIENESRVVNPFSWGRENLTIGLT